MMKGFMATATISMIVWRTSMAVGSLSECLTGEDATITDVSTVDWTAAYSMVLDPGDACWHTTFTTSYAWWHSSQSISVKT